MDLNELNNTYLASRKHLGTIGDHWIQYIPQTQTYLRSVKIVKNGGLIIVRSGMFGLPLAHVQVSKCIAMDLNELNNTYLASRKHLRTIWGH